MARRIAGPDGAGREGWVADGEIIVFWQPRLGEILVPDASGRIEELRDADGGGVHLDALRDSSPESCSGARAKKRPLPQPGPKTRPPSKPI